MSGRGERFLEVKGVALAAVLGLLVWLSVACYQKAFTDSVGVVVDADRAGLQLSAHGDVRARGALVGRITGIELEHGHVAIHLALDPDAAAQLPADVAARIVPTTLFGQKYVDLVPRGASGVGAGGALTDGATIPLDRSATAVELTRAFDALEPVLSDVQPQYLSQTLQAMAQGLDGRGERLGATVAASAAYLRTFNRHLPRLVEDLRLFDRLTRVYTRITPDLLRMLGHDTVTAHTLVERQQAMAAVQHELTILAGASTRFFQRNGEPLVLSQVLSEPVMQLFARYSPELPCTFAGLVIGQANAANTFRGGKLRASLSVSPDMAAYTPSDRPAYGDHDGPGCHGLPRPAPPLQVPSSNDGADHPGPAQPGGTP